MFPGLPPKTNQPAAFSKKYYKRKIKNFTMDSNSEVKSKLETVKVVVRCRPMSEKETTASYHKVVKLYPDRGGVEVQIKTQNSKYFTFDAVYDGGNQADIYDEVFRP
ncbi:uncharacterized protein CEXT_88801 [Caerostris extrusa]|uniref:Kinesin motor domain-containing protein n=1 Tax=Caerostris extrusa TaxID=172846 RepID=A0AAV4VDW1_CAEEX|nr:uncharacterized protein CEXT_88801 [Caerostris extrusa]